MHPLDQLSSLDNYRRLFISVPFWTPYVRQACTRHGLPCQAITCGLPGSMPTFLIDQKQVIKFFGPLFGGAHSYEIERTIALLLQKHPVIPTPALLFEGHLDPPGAQWDWPYLILEFLPGKSIGQVWADLPAAERTLMAHQMGGWLRALHALPLPEDGPLPDRWNEFDSFLVGQHAACAQRHQTWGSLPSHLIAEIEDYLPPVSELYDPSQPPHLIHADLTGDHLLGSLQDGHWSTTGLIDFGDARVGNLYYELPALHLDLFKAESPLLEDFLEAYGTTPGPDFARMALSYCLLHEFNIFDSEIGQSPRVQEARNLDDLAARLWGPSTNTNC